MPKKATERRTCYLSVTMTPDQERDIIEAADAAGQSKSTYALRSILGQVERDKKAKKRT